jgi:hypothetical protein
MILYIYNRHCAKTEHKCTDVQNICNCLYRTPFFLISYLNLQQFVTAQLSCHYFTLKKLRGRIWKTEKEMKKWKRTNESRISAVQRENTIYSGTKFVPTSEVCVVPRYRSSWRDIRRRACLQWHAGGRAEFRGNLWVESTRSLRKSALYVHIHVFSKMIKFTVMRRITTFRSTTDRIYDGGAIRLYCVKIAYSIQYSNIL